jgi:hypothetical protein
VWETEWVLPPALAKGIGTALQSARQWEIGRMFLWEIGRALQTALLWGIGRALQTALLWGIGRALQTALLREI